MPNYGVCDRRRRRRQSSHNEFKCASDELRCTHVISYILRAFPACLSLSPFFSLSHKSIQLTQSIQDMPIEISLDRSSSIKCQFMADIYGCVRKSYRSIDRPNVKSKRKKNFLF